MPPDRDDLRERLVKVETELFNFQANIDLRVQLAASQIRAEINVRQGRTDIANALVFGMAAIVLAGFLGVVVAYFQGRPLGAPVSIHSTNGGTR